MRTDSQFTASVPAIYDRYMRPMKFEPYAQDLAGRAAALKPRCVLETAAGTGVVTAALLVRLPDADIVATDLNQAMLDVAAGQIQSTRLRFQQADATSLPFDDGSFDLVVCQFGVMFFPDRIAGYREARRVLRDGGTFLFNSWDRIELNPITATAVAAVAELFAEDPPRFFDRVPFGYHDVEAIRRDLAEAGFRQVHIETVIRQGRAESAEAAAIGLCQGTPWRAEIEERGAGKLELATEAAAAALERRFGTGAIRADMSAHVVEAR